MPQREFLGWTRPLLDLAVDWLWQRRDSLPHLLIVVPTAQSGRRLREALAMRGGGLAPQVITPDSFFRPPAAPGIATALEERYAWIESLRRIPVEEAPALFPIEPVDRSFTWASSVTAELLSAWDSLSEGGSSFEDARRESPEPERWQDISRLHRSTVARLRRWGKHPRAEAKARAAAEPALPPETREVIIIGVPEPAPLALQAWQQIETRGIPLRILIHAPGERADDFDDWGRPREKPWISEPVPLSRERIHLTAGAPELSKQVVQLCSGSDSDQVTAGLCDPAYGPALEAAFAEAGWKAWNPEGKTAGRPMANLLRGLAALGAAKPSTWPEISALLRSPLLGPVLGEDGLFEALSALDAVERDHLPDSLDRLANLIARSAAKPGMKRLATMVEWLLEWRDLFANQPASTAIRQWVEEMRLRGVDDGAEGGLYLLLESAAPHLAALEREARLDDPADAIDLALTGSDSLRSLQGRDEAVLDLPGWLELSFENAPLMILAGMHDGAVPDGRLDDAFLPDGVRVKLGLRDSKARHARDAFLLRSFAESRRVEIVVAKVDPLGEPRRPSRLLLASTGRDLAERVLQLAGQPPVGSSRRLSAWERGPWKLEFEGEPRPYLDGARTLSPSALRDYLHCPFRFYLKRLLKWERYEADKLEMNPRDFGNVCHRAFEAMGLDDTMKATTDVSLLSDFLISHVDEALRVFYGLPLSLPLMVQREAAISRLKRFAEREVEDRMNGWMIRQVELRVGDEQYAWSIAGQPVMMQIDRIDEHPTLGMRVLDYKSSARADPPEYAHLRTFSDKRRTYGPTLTTATGSKKERVWKNVQLPLYAAFVKQHFALSQVPAVGYVNLPATLNDIGISMWTGFDDSMLTNALEWTTGAIEAMRLPLHWPPVELTGAESRMDDFADLAPDGFEAAVAGPLIERFRADATRYDEERRTSL